MLVSAGLALAIVNVFNVILQVEQKDFDIPVRYTEYGASPIVLGDWFTLYEFLAFAVVATIFNVVIALRLHKERRQLSIAMLIAQIIIMIFLLLVSRAVLGLPAVS